MLMTFQDAFRLLLHLDAGVIGIVLVSLQVSLSALLLGTLLGLPIGALLATEEFQGKQTILCPLQENSPQDTDLIEGFWRSVGSVVKKISNVQHDAIYAAVSHLPHILSYALMASVVNSEDAEQKLSHVGAGFKDFTRIAASSPEMWRDICLGNRGAILQELDRYLLIVNHMRKLIADGDGAGLEKLFNQASKARQDLDEA
jgi:prephenate dehydrogenase